MTPPDQDPIIAPINRGIEKGFWFDPETLQAAQVKKAKVHKKLSKHSIQENIFFRNELIIHCALNLQKDHTISEKEVRNILLKLGSCNCAGGLK